MSAPVRLGLVGDWGDPVAQLVQDLPGEHGKDLVEIIDPATDAEAVDEFLVLAQADALVHLAGLIASGKPCRILLRRADASGEGPGWRKGLLWLAECLRLSGWAGYRLVALTQAAADEINALMEMPVAALAPLPAIAHRRPVIEVGRDEEDAAFTLTDDTGRRETRRVDVSLFNWVRLRRLAQLQAAETAGLHMADLVAFANGAQQSVQPGRSGPAPRCLLVVVPNGVGLGHITRMMAICKGLQGEGALRVIFWSYSRAAEILGAAGFEVILRQTAAHIDAHPPSWRRWEIEEFARAIIHFDVRLVAMDGGAIDRFITEALKRPGCGHCGILWVRRGMLRPETDADMLENEQVCDLVLEPGDLAVEMDEGPTRTRTARNKGFSRSIVTRPVTLKPFLPTYSRREAKRRLGLGWGRHCLVSLGGAFGDWDMLQALLQKYARKAGVRLIWAQSPLAAPPKLDDARTEVRQFYPLGPYMAAFDGVVTATGYNSYHELMLGYDGPVLFAPTNRDRLDDQEARARYAEDQGWAHVVYTSRLQDQERIIGAFMSDVRSGRKGSGRPAFDLDTAAYAREISGLFDRYEPGG